MLWESDVINYKTSAQTVNVDITNQQYVKFSLGGTVKYADDIVLFKDVLLQ